MDWFLYDIGLRHERVKITSNGRSDLVGVIGTYENINKYIDEKIDEWCKEIEVLSTIAATYLTAGKKLKKNTLSNTYSRVMNAIT